MFNEHIIQLKNGRIAQRSKQENIARIKSYFESVKFLEWEDIDPPKIRISKDGTMAYIIVHKRVRSQKGHTVFAWLEAWEKVESVWRLMAVASTDRPGDE